MSSQSRNDRESRFAGFLQGLAKNENRGALAALRRGLSAEGSAAAGMHRYIAGWLLDKDKPWDESCIYLVAALFGRYPSTESTTGVFGASCRQYMESKGSESFERRFVALLAADSASVGVHLRHVISLLASEGVPVDWAQLLRDLRWWGYPEGRIQRHWAREFWKRTEAANAEQAPNQEATQQSQSDRIKVKP